MSIQETVQISGEQALRALETLDTVLESIRILKVKEEAIAIANSEVRKITAPFLTKARAATADLRGQVKVIQGQILEKEKPLRDEANEKSLGLREKASMLRKDYRNLKSALYMMASPESKKAEMGA